MKTETEILVLKHQKEALQKMCIELQKALHFISNIYNKDRHTGEMQDCQEMTCTSFHKAMDDVEKLALRVKND